MKTISKTLVVIVFFITLLGFVTDPLYAAGIVPCGMSDVVVDGLLEDECNFCDLQLLALNLLNFLVLATAIVAALLFLNAGVLYVMSSANPGNIAKAHKIFVNTLVGMIVVFASWLAINQVMIIIYKDSLVFFEYGDWSDILNNCVNVAHPAPPGPVGAVVTQVEASGPGYTDADFEGAPDGYRVLSDSALADGLSNISNNCIAGGDTCTDYIIAQANAQGVDPNYALALAAVESGGCSNPPPASCTSGAGAVGVIQLMPATARDMCGPECAGLTNAEMAVLLTEPTNNIKWGVAYMKQSSTYVDSLGLDPTRKNDYMAAYYNGGPTALQPSVDCPGLTKYECTINPGGYTQTQDYVEKMNTYVNSVDKGTTIVSEG